MVGVQREKEGGHQYPPVLGNSKDGCKIVKFRGSLRKGNKESRRFKKQGPKLGVEILFFCLLYGLRMSQTCLKIEVGSQTEMANSTTSGIQTECVPPYTLISKATIQILNRKMEEQQETIT